jgi:hypothetical protein
MDSGSCFFGNPKVVNTIYIITKKSEKITYLFLQIHDLHAFMYV